MRRITFRLLILTLVMGFPATALAQEAAGRSSETAPPRTWAVHLGAGSAKAWNFMGVTKEFLLNEHTTLFLTAGFGTILVGGGAAYYTNRSGSGLVASATAGLAGAHLNLGGQLKVSRRGFLTAGGSFGTYFLQYRGSLPFAAFEYRF